MEGTMMLMMMMLRVSNVLRLMTCSREIDRNCNSYSRRYIEYHIYVGRKYAQFQVSLMNGALTSHE
jgi:hypothetical protein